MSWQIPQGIEVLVKKASVDAEFRALLLDQRAEAARTIGLMLDEAEASMLAAVPGAQLEAIIARTTVPQEHRRAFLGKAAAAMVAALGSTGMAKATSIPAPTGIAPDRPPGPSIQSRVFSVVAQQLGVPVSSISRETTLENNPKIDPPRREAIRKGLEKEFDLTISAAAFARVKSVGVAVAYIEAGGTVGLRVVDVLAKELKIGKEQLTREKSLVGDLRIGTSQLAELRRELTRVFRVYIAWEEFKKLRTVGDLIDHVQELVKKRGDAQKQQPAEPIPTSRGVRPDRPASMGIRPGAPPASGLGGMRPGSSAPRSSVRPRDPVREAEEVRRRAEEFRRRYGQQ